MLALNKIFGFKPAVALTLVENLGSAAAVFAMSEEQKQQIMGPWSACRDQLNKASVDWADGELSRIEALGHRFIHVGDDCYPALLRECEDAPLGLYFRGCSPPEEVFGNMDPIAIVGTRDLSPYGREWCSRIVRSMASGATSPELSLGNSGRGPTIVSGLALGTDICAHLEALDSGLTTVAVMATGIETVYPWRHNAIAERIASTPGCALITDYPTGTTPVALNFLRRNRIIAGMSRATILVESKAHGGGIMTANLSYSYNRDTYALLGRADDLCSQGCNNLIRAKVAEPVTDCESLLASLNLRCGKIEEPTPELLAAKMKRAGASDDRVGKAAQVLLAIKNCRGISFDELVRATGLPFREVAAIATRLECDGMIDIDMLQRCSINIK